MSGIAISFGPLGTNERVDLSVMIDEHTDLAQRFARSEYFQTRCICAFGPHEKFRTSRETVLSDDVRSTVAREFAMEWHYG